MKSSVSKTISVVMCTYNGAKYLRQQLDSILGQTLQPQEILVQDDGSTDGTWQILEEYASRTSQMKIFHNEGSHGINSNFFSALRKAQGELLALSDQDDIWEPDKLEVQAEALGENWLCSGFSVPFSEDGFPVSDDRRRPNFHILRLSYIGALPGHTFLMRRELLDYLPVGEQCPYLYDWQLQMVAAAAEKIIFVDKLLVHFRRHAEAATANRPVDNRWTSWSSWDYLRITLFHHRRLQQEIRKRFQTIESLLLRWNFSTQSSRECLTMARLQQERGLLNFFKKTHFFILHRHDLSFAEEQTSWKAWLRAFYFPFSCGYYYRNILKQK